jgi:hypothetical protein
MRVFLSAYSGFTLAIPMEDVGAMMLYKQKTENIVQYDQKSRCTFISLPWLFNMRDVAVPHGIILRNWNSKENKVVCLTAGIKRDIDIPDAEFYPIPKSLCSTDFYALFSGIKFSDNPILLLNMKHLPQIIQREYQEKENKDVPYEQPAPIVTSKPSPPPPPKKVIEEPPIIPAEASKPTPPPPPKITEKPPLITAEASKPAPPPPPKITEKLPIITAEAFDPLVFDEVLEICEIIEEPPTSPAEASDSLVFDEVLEICEIIEEPPTSPAKVSDSLVFDEVLEICEIIEEPPTSPAEAADSSIPSDEDIEISDVIDESVEISDYSFMFDEVIEVSSEAADSFLMLDEAIDFIDVQDDTPTDSAAASEPSPPATNEIIEEFAEASGSFIFDEAVELCDDFD